MLTLPEKKDTITALKEAVGKDRDLRALLSEAALGEATVSWVESVGGFWNGAKNAEEETAIIRRLEATLAPVSALPVDSEARKRTPLCAGLLDYFPAALAAVAQVSWHGNEKHNPGEPLHHARGRSTDHADCIARHLVERGGFDGPMRHSACLAWRALALLQQELEDAGLAPLARNARLPEADK